MIRRQGHIPVADASHQRQRRCHHLSRKIEVRYDSQHGEAVFPWGHCTLHAQDDLLRFDGTAIDSHIERSARQAPVRVAWSDAATPGAPPAT